MRFSSASLGIAVLALTCAPAFAGGKPDATNPQDWNRFTAAKYLDARETWWLGWTKSQRDHATACISCHTAVPYALARPSLRQSLGETELSATEKTMMAYVVKRVTLWDEVEPFYNDAKSGPRKTPESRGTESVLNALLLARYDAPQDHMRAITRDAFANMWKMQLTEGADAGSWDWLNFHNAPWESDESHYYGATLAAIAVGMAPDDYRNTPDIQSHLQNLRAYLNHNYDQQPLVNRIVLLWASARIPGLLAPAQRKALLANIAAHQSTDGGWSLTQLGSWKRRDNTPLDQHSDGYATGLTVYAMKQAGYSSQTPEMQRAIHWLKQNQDAKDGKWYATSLNKQRDPASDPGLFMTDASTSYSVLALEATGH
jgi:squalene-hopene/tetraprenyl-beta-curcumene cyclase